MAGILWERHQRWLRILPWVGLFLLFISGLLGDRGILRLHQLKQEQERLEASIREQEKTKLELTREVRALHGDPKYLEQLARDELGLVRPGEVVYQFPPEDSKK